VNPVAQAEYGNQPDPESDAMGERRPRPTAF
jgi:hypothetical protein